MRKKKLTFKYVIELFISSNEFDEDWFPMGEFGGFLSILAL